MDVVVTTVPEGASGLPFLEPCIDKAQYHEAGGSRTPFGGRLLQASERLEESQMSDVAI